MRMFVAHDTLKLYTQIVIFEQAPSTQAIFRHGQPDVYKTLFQIRRTEIIKRGQQTIAFVIYILHHCYCSMLIHLASN